MKFNKTIRLHRGITADHASEILVVRFVKKKQALCSTHFSKALFFNVNKFPQSIYCNMGIKQEKCSLLVYIT